MSDESVRKLLEKTQLIVKKDGEYPEAAKMEMNLDDVEHETAEGRN